MMAVFFQQPARHNICRGADGRDISAETCSNQKPKDEQRAEVCAVLRCGERFGEPLRHRQHRSKIGDVIHKGGNSDRNKYNDGTAP